MKMRMEFDDYYDYDYGEHLMRFNYNTVQAGVRFEKEKKIREENIQSQNELVEAGVVSFGSAQAKNRKELDLLNAKIEESKQKIRELFVDSPELADEFVKKIDEMTSSYDKLDDKVSHVFTGFETGLRNAADGFTRWADLGIQAGEAVATSISEGVSDAFVEAIRGTKNFGDAMKEMTASILADIAKMIVKTIILRTIMSAIGFGMNEGGAVPSMAMAGGGSVPGPNINRDIVPAKLTPGEYVHRKQAVDFYGSGVMRAINKMLIPREALFPFSKGIGPLNRSGFFAEGGQVASSKSNEPAQAFIVADSQAMDRLLAGGGSAMSQWLSNNRTRVKSILGI